MSEKIIQPPSEKPAETNEPHANVPLDGGFADDIQEQAAIKSGKTRGKEPDNVYKDEDDFYSSKLNVAEDGKPLPPQASSKTKAQRRSKPGLLFIILILVVLAALGVLYYLEAAYYTGTLLHDGLGRAANFINQTIKSLRK